MSDDKPRLEGELELRPEDVKKKLPELISNLPEALQDLLADVDPERQLIIVTQLLVQHEEYFESWDAPLPHPRAFADYEKTLPGSGKVILNELVAQGKHMRDMEAISLKNVIKYRFKGQWFGFGVVVSSICGVLAAVYLGAAPYVAAIIGAIGVGNIVNMFLTGRVQSNQEEKKQPEPEKEDA